MEKMFIAVIATAVAVLIGLCVVIVRHEIRVSCLTAGVVVSKQFTPAHLEVIPEADGAGGVSVSAWWEDDSWAITFSGTCAGRPDQLTRTVEVDRQTFDAAAVGNAFELNQ